MKANRFRFRAWDERTNPKLMMPPEVCEGWALEDLLDSGMTVMQSTGLTDKNGLTEVFEGDILDENGLVKGNIYESPQIYREGIDHVVTGLGTKAWRESESIAVGRGCQYAE